MQLYRLPQVLEYTGLGSRSSVWRAVKSGTFPAPVVVGRNRICWRLEDLEAWSRTLPKREYSRPGNTGT